MGRIVCSAHPFVLYRLLTRKREDVGKPKLGKNNQCANVQLKTSKSQVGAEVVQWQAHNHTACLVVIVIVIFTTMFMLLSS